MILVQLTDLHIRPRGMAANRNAETNMLTERAVRAVARLEVRPDAMVISGDLTDNGLPEEYQLLADILRRNINIPVYVIPGNHDHRATMKAELAHLPGVTADPVFGHYTVEEHEIRLVMLDTIIPGEGGGELCPARLAWLDSTLAAQPDRPTIVVMHHPPFATGIAYMDAIGLRETAPFVAIIARNPQVKRILCGHVHRPINAAIGHAIASISPSVAHQLEFTLSDKPGFWNLEPAAFAVHATIGGAIVSHTLYVEDFPGPFPFSSAN